jgi:hypothetical protein
MNTLEYVLLVILIYGSLLAGLVYFAIKQTRLFVILLGVAAIIAAIPVGFLAEVSINGCCGAPSTNHEGIGFILGALLGILGIVLLIKNGKFKKKLKRQL